MKRLISSSVEVLEELVRFHGWRLVLKGRSLLAAAFLISSLVVGVGGTSGPASASSTDCLSYAYGCTPGYTASNTQGTWAWSHYGNIPGNDISTPTGLHNCTLYAAWRLEQAGMSDPGNWGNAATWINHTSWNHNPTVGSIAWYAGTGSNPAGHVAYVEQVSGSSVFIRADNYWAPHGYTDAGWVSASSVGAFLHPHDVPSGPPPNGSFVSYQGNVYVIAGGAPLYVHSWDVFGGPQQTEALSDGQWASLNSVPADGSFIREAQSGRIYRLAGGSPMYISSCIPLSGCPGDVTIDEWAVDNAGNPLSHLRQVPSDGTFISDLDDGRVFKVAGGAPLYVSAADASRVPGYGTLPVTAVSGWEFSNYQHLRQVPSNGTFVSNVDTGQVFEIAGGAPLYVSAADASRVPGYNNGATTVTTSGWAFTHYQNLRRFPSNGTFLTAFPGGKKYRVAGGAPLAISRCAAIGGCRSAVAIDRWDIQNRIPRSAHLSPRPKNWTLVERLPSRTFWRFIAGHWRRVQPASGSVSVNDSSR